LIIISTYAGNQDLKLAPS